MNQITPAGYTAIGVAVVGFLSWLFGSLLPKLIGKTIDARFERKNREDQEYRKEQVEDAIRQQKGQQVMTNSLLVILQHMIYGNHVENLEKAQKDLQAFHAENEAALLRKAAKYNLR